LRRGGGLARRLLLTRKGDEKVKSKLQELTKALRAAGTSPNGDPRGNGPRCATCGDLALWGTHPGCRTRRGRLLVWAA
jgi:hypothetical protein